MDWVTWIIIGGAIGAFVVFKRAGLASPETARAWLGKGARVIDVRSEAEFRERHLPQAVNIPLGQLRAEIARHVPNRDQEILLHCLSGGRSGIGRSMLKRMGYQHVLNLGSYGRAEKILGAQQI